MFAGDYGLYEISYRNWLYVPDAAAPLTFTSRRGVEYRIDEIFEFDGASIPRMFWAIPGLDPMDWPKAAALHDYLWVLRYTRRNPVGFIESNLLLSQAIRASGWSVFLAVLVFVFVTLFGWAFWFRGYKV